MKKSLWRVISILLCIGMIFTMSSPGVMMTQAYADDGSVWVEVDDIAAAAAFSFLQFVMLEYSCNLKISIIENFSNKDHGFIGLNVLALFVMQMIIRLFAGKWSVTLLISTVIASVWSVANYFTVLYHGGPLYPSELRSAATAVEVMGDYSYDIDHYVKRLILMGAVMLAASVLYIFLERKGRFHTWRRTAGTAAGIAAGAACLYVFLFSPVKITPKLMVGWDWKHGVERFGFPVTAIEDVYKMINSISKPDGCQWNRCRISSWSSMRHITAWTII